MIPSQRKLSWKEGTPLFDYQIEKELCNGAYGVLYEAVHREHQNRVALVVLKQVDDTLADDKKATPFLDGLESLRELAHPNLAPIRELWHFEGLFFLISEYPPGKSLPERLNRSGDEEGLQTNGRNDLIRFVRLLREVAGGLREAHRQGLTHQDLRAEDLIIQEDGTPVLLGFGWAPLLGRSELSPEQKEVRKAGEKPAFRTHAERTQSDIASLGKIMLQLLSSVDTSSKTKIRSRRRKPFDPGVFPAGLGAVYRRIEGMDASFRPYSASSLCQDLDQCLATLERRSLVKKWLRFFFPAWHGLSLQKKRIAGMSMVFFLVAVCFFSSVVLTRFFSLSDRFISLKNSVPEPFDLQDQGSGLSKVREERLSRLFSKIEDAPAAAPLRRDRGRYFQERGCWEEALTDYLMAHYLDGSLFVGRDLLSLAACMYDGGRNRAADQVLDRVIEWYHGTEWAVRALLAKKRLVPDQTSLHRLAGSLERLIQGPFRHDPLFEKQALPHLEQARMLCIERYPLPDRMWVVGDFLPGPGDEIAWLLENRLVLTGKETRKEIALRDDPQRLKLVAAGPESREKIALGYASGRMEILDPGTGELEEIFDLTGRLHNGIFLLTDPEGRRRYVFPVADEKGINLAMIEALTNRETPTPQFFHYEGTGLSALLPVEGLPGLPGQGLLILIDNEVGTRLSLLGFEKKEGRYREFLNLTLRERVGAALVIPGEAGTLPEILLGIEATLTPVEKSEGVQKLSRIYSLSLLVEDLSGSSPEITRFGLLEPVKILDPGQGWGGVEFPGACRGDFDGNGRLDAAFLVRYPGRGTQPPETRLLWGRDGSDFLWLQGREMYTLRCGDLDGRPGDEMLLENSESLLGISWRTDLGETGR
ncbi:MAG: protein kinase [Planctomycetes bacterium]|nr:protein kinase [Planctomycetota bacterium]